MTSLSAAPATTAWRVIDSGPADGATNMATDVALMDHARRTGERTLRVYTWSRPTLSFGRHEATRGRFAPATLEAAGVDPVRRPTGGRALLHHREVTYAVTGPVAGLSLAASYASINALLVDALARLGVAAVPALRLAPVERPGASSCFAAPADGELVVGGAKLVGSAQWREGGAFLQHGSILLDDDQALIPGLLEPAGREDRVPTARVATLGALLGRAVSPGEVRRALFSALADRCAREGVTSPALVESDSGTSDAIGLHRQLFSDASWTWRR